MNNERYDDGDNIVDASSRVFVHFLLFHISLFTFVDIGETMGEKCHAAQICDSASVIITHLYLWIKIEHVMVKRNIPDFNCPINGYIN